MVLLLIIRLSKYYHPKKIISNGHFMIDVFIGTGIIYDIIGKG